MICKKVFWTWAKLQIAHETEFGLLVYADDWVKAVDPKYSLLWKSGYKWSLVQDSKSN